MAITGWRSNSARAKVATQEATIGRIGHQIAAQEAAVEQAKTQLVSAQAAATRTELELDRQNLLVARDASSRQLLEQAQANRDQAIAGVHGAQGRHRFGRRQCRRPQRSAAGSVRHARRTQDCARQGRARSVLHRHSRADRRRDRQSRHADRRLRADRPAARERSAARRGLRQRQFQGNAARAACGPASRSPSPSTRCQNIAIQGTVESFSPASGAVFSLLPPDNATGNFTKIVQRLPGAHPRAGRHRPRRRAAARLVGRSQRQYQGERGRRHDRDAPAQRTAAR